jgi:hypothetical protein
MPPIVTPLNLWVITLCCTVSMIGLSGDIGRHLRNGTAINSDFWASWHLVLYSGVLGLGGWLGRMAIVHGTKEMRAAFGPTVYGMFTLCTGGLCDWAWHSIFGIEVSIPALLSPPHLMLLTGLVLVLLGPIAALWREPGNERLSWSSTAVVSICALGLITVVSLFTGYISVFASDVIVNGYANPMVGTRLSSTEVIHSVATMIWTSLVLAVPYIVLRLRWRLRPGMIAIPFVIIAITASVSVQGVAHEVVSSTLIGGFVIDGVIAVATRRLDADKSLLVTAATVPIVLWVFIFVSLQFSGRLVWGTTVWAGGTVLSTLITLAFAGMLVLARRLGAATPAAT